MHNKREEYRRFAHIDSIKADDDFPIDWHNGPDRQHCWHIYLSMLCESVRDSNKTTSCTIGSQYTREVKGIGLEKNVEEIYF